MVRFNPGQRRRMILVAGNTVVTSGAIILQVSARSHLEVWIPALIVISVVTGMLAIGTEWLISEGGAERQGVPGPDGNGPDGGSAPPAVPGVPGVPLSLELPPSDDQFVGRRRELDKLCDMLERLANDGRGSPVLELSGMGGVGKTTLAVQFAEEVRRRYPGGVLYLALGGTSGTEAPDPATLLGRLLSALGVRAGEVPPELDARHRLYLDRLAGRRVLVLLDDAKSAAQVRPLLARVRGSATVITSRRQLGLLEADPFVVRGLDEAALTELLTNVVGRRRVEQEPEAAERIVRACGGLPLALRLIAARLHANKHLTLTELSGRLSLDDFRSGDVRARDAIAVSYADLSDKSKRAFRLLNLFPSASMREWAVAPLLDIPVVESRILMEDLVEAQLLERAARGRFGGAEYRFHSLVREYAAERLAAEDSAEEQRAAFARLGGAFLALAEYAEHLTDPTVPRHSGPGGPAGPVGPVGLGAPAGPGAQAGPGRRPPGHADHWHVDDPDLLRYAETDPTRWLLGDCRRLGRIAERAGGYGLWDLCWETSIVLARVLETVYTVWNRWDDVLAAGLSAARRQGDLRAESIIRQGYGVLRHYQDRYAEAEEHFTEALRLCREIGHRPGEAYTLRWIGRSHFFAGHFGAAVDELERALELSRELGNRLAEARVLRDLSEAYAGLRRFRDAEEAIRAALDLFEADAVAQDPDSDVRQPAEAARARRDLGVLLARTYRLEEADEQLAQALEALTDLGHWYWGAATVFDLGMLRLRQGRPDEAEELILQAYDTFRTSGYRYMTAVVGRRLAMLRLEQGRTEDASEYVLPALETFRQLDLGLWESYTLRVLGWLRREEGRLDAADQYLEDAAELARHYDDAWGLARALSFQASLRMAERRPEEAVRLYREVAALTSRYEEPWQDADMLGDLAKALRAVGDRSGAAEAEAEARAAAALVAEARRAAGAAGGSGLPGSQSRAGRRRGSRRRG